MTVGVLICGMHACAGLLMQALRLPRRTCQTTASPSAASTRSTMMATAAQGSQHSTAATCRIVHSRTRAAGCGLWQPCWWLFCPQHSRHRMAQTFLLHRHGCSHSRQRQH